MDGCVEGKGRLQLFTRAFTSRICDRRRLFYPPFYIPGTVYARPTPRGRPFATSLVKVCRIKRSKKKNKKKEGTPASCMYAARRLPQIPPSYSLGSDSPT